MKIPKYVAAVRITTLGLLIICAFTTHLLAREHGQLLNSPAFCDPNDLQEMPQEWVSKSISHPEDLEEDVDLYMTLSYQLYDLLAEKIRRFAKDHAFSVVVKNASCSTSSRMLMKKEIDIASFCCTPTNKDHLPGVQFHTAGIIPVAVLVNKANPVNNISWEDLIKIFRGEIVNWSPLGGEPRLIQPVARLHCNTRPGRWQVLNTYDELSSNITLVGGIDDNLKFISRTKGGIGYESLPGDTLHEFPELKMLSIDGISPTDLNALAHGDYPYFRSYTFSEWTGEKLENPYAKLVLEFLDKEISSFDHGLGTVPITALRKIGWKFSGDELVGWPN